MKPLRRPSRRYLDGNDLTGTLPSQLGNLNLDECYLSWTNPSTTPETNKFDCPLPANLPDDHVCRRSDNPDESYVLVCSTVDVGSNGDPHLILADGGKADERVERASSPVHGACTQLAPTASLPKHAHARAPFALPTHTRGHGLGQPAREVCGLWAAPSCQRPRSGVLPLEPPGPRMVPTKVTRSCF